MTPVDVYVFDSQPIVIEGIRGLLNGTEEFRFAGASPSPAGLADEVISTQPDLVLVDWVLGWNEIRQFLSELRFRSPESKMILWGTGFSPGDCSRAIQAGVKGVLRKNLPVASLLACLQAVSQGQTWLDSALEQNLNEDRWNIGAARLTPRERDIVRLVSRGLKNREIADQLDITTGTVKVHLMHVFEKTGVKDRYELAVQARALLEAGTAGRRHAASAAGSNQ